MACGTQLCLVLTRLAARDTSLHPCSNRWHPGHLLSSPSPRPSHWSLPLMHVLRVCVPTFDSLVSRTWPRVYGHKKSHRDRHILIHTYQRKSIKRLLRNLINVKASWVLMFTSGPVKMPYQLKSLRFASDCLQSARVTVDVWFSYYSHRFYTLISTKILLIVNTIIK